MYHRSFLRCESNPEQIEGELLQRGESYEVFKRCRVIADSFGLHGILGDANQLCE